MVTESDGVAQAPPARRLGKPRWFDVRVIGGIVLLITSVVLGARIVGTASQTSAVWVVAHDIAAGTVLELADLVAEEANLGQRGGAYIDAQSPVAGQLLTSEVHAGELLPAAAIMPVGDARIVAVSVAPERMAPGVAHGSVIDLYLVSGRAAIIGEEVTTELLHSAATVQSVSDPASGGLSGVIVRKYQVALLLSPMEADSLVRAISSGEPLVVLHSRTPSSSLEVN